MPVRSVLAEDLSGDGQRPPSVTRRLCYSQKSNFRDYCLLFVSCRKFHRRLPPTANASLSPSPNTNQQCPPDKPPTPWVCAILAHSACLPVLLPPQNYSLLGPTLLPKIRYPRLLGRCPLEADHVHGRCHGHHDPASQAGGGGL